MTIFTLPNLLLSSEPHPLTVSQCLIWLSSVTGKMAKNLPINISITYSSKENKAITVAGILFWWCNSYIPHANQDRTFSITTWKRCMCRMIIISVSDLKTASFSAIKHITDLCMPTRHWNIVLVGLWQRVHTNHLLNDWSLIKVTLKYGPSWHHE